MLVCSRRVLANRNSLVMFLDAEALGQTKCWRWLECWTLLCTNFFERCFCCNVMFMRITVYARRQQQNTSAFKFALFVCCAVLISFLFLRWLAVCYFSDQLKDNFRLNWQACVPFSAMLCARVVMLVVLGLQQWHVLGEERNALNYLRGKSANCTTNSHVKTKQWLMKSEQVTSAGTKSNIKSRTLERTHRKEKFATDERQTVHVCVLRMHEYLHQTRVRE